MKIKVGDWVKINGGTKSLGETGKIMATTKVMAQVKLTKTQEVARKAKKNLEVIPDPTSTMIITKDDNPNNANNNEDDDVNTSTANINNGTDVMVVVGTKDLTETNKHQVLQAAKQALEGICGANTVDGDGIILSIGGSLIFGMTRTEHARAVVDKEHLEFWVDDDHFRCAVAFAEKASTPEGSSTAPFREIPQKLNHRRDEMNQEALPKGRSLFDRMEANKAGHTSKRRRRM